MGSYVAVAAAVIAVAATAYSTYRQVEAVEAESKFLKAEAQAREDEAKTIRDSASFEEAKTRRRTQILLAKQRAIGAAAGVDIASGTPIFMELDNTRQAELEALNVRRSGAIAAGGREFEGKLLRSKARYLRNQKSGIIIGGVLSAASSGLSAYSGYSSGGGSSAGSSQAV